MHAVVSKLYVYMYVCLFTGVYIHICVHMVNWLKCTCAHMCAGAYQSCGCVDTLEVCGHIRAYLEAEFGSVTLKQEVEEGVVTRGEAIFPSWRNPFLCEQGVP